MSTGRIVTTALAAFVVAAGAAAWYVAARPHRMVKPTGFIVESEPREFVWTDSGLTVGFVSRQRAVAGYLDHLGPGSRVLDLGCGDGAILASLRGRGWTLVGVDISELGIAEARRAWPDIRFEIGDATGDLSALGQFDAVISTEVIEHISLPHHFAANAYRLLRPGGTLVLTTPYHGWLKNLAIAATGYSDSHYEPLFDYGHIKFWSVRTLSQLLWEAGFDDLEWVGAGRVPYLWRTLVMRAARPRSP